MNIAFLRPGDTYDINLHELGIAPDQAAVRVSVQAPHGLQGYTYELFGTYEMPDSPLEVFRFQLLMGVLPRGAGVGGLRLVAWRRRVLCEGTSIYVEARWCPTTRGTWLRTDGSEEDMQKHKKRADRGLMLLMAIEGPGRPRRSKKMSEAKFRQKYPETYQQLLDEYESKPYRYEVAEALHLHPETFSDYLKEYNLPFPPF